MSEKLTVFIFTNVTPIVPDVQPVIRRAVFGIRQSPISDEVSDTHSKGVRNNFQGLDCHILFAALNFTNMRTVQAGTVGENVLRPALLHSQCPYRRADFFLNLLHSSQFGRTLVKSIQVISCIGQDPSRRSVQAQLST